MNQIIQIILGVSVLAFPMILFWIYLTTLDKKTEKMIQDHSNDSSEIFTDLKVWFKNFDVLKKKNKFDLNPYQTLYSFNNCDLIVNDKNIVVIGKIKVLGKNKSLNPIIFEFEKNQSTLNPSHVKIKNIQEIGNDIEIEFSDDNYTGNITFVIKRAENKLKEKIKNVPQQRI